MKLLYSLPSWPYESPPLRCWAHIHLGVGSDGNVRQAFFLLSHKSSLLNFIPHVRGTNKCPIHIWVPSSRHPRSRMHAYIYLDKQNQPLQVFLNYESEILEHLWPTQTSHSQFGGRLQTRTPVWFSPPSTLTSHPCVAIRPLLTCPAQSLWPRGKWLPQLISTPLSHPAPGRPGRLISHALNLLIRLFHVRFLYLGS